MKENQVSPPPLSNLFLTDRHFELQRKFAISKINHYCMFREQRVTGVMVFILTGLSVKLAPILKVPPK